MAALRLASQRTMAWVANRLSDGAPEDWFTAVGTSMRPAVRTVQRVRLRPVTATDTLLGEIVLVRVAGRWWLHRVVEEQPSRVLIAGDNGMVNGWTPRSDVAGVLVRRVRVRLGRDRDGRGADGRPRAC